MIDSCNEVVFISTIYHSCTSTR